MQEASKTTALIVIGGGTPVALAACARHAVRERKSQRRRQRARTRRRDADAGPRGAHRTCRPHDRCGRCARERRAHAQGGGRESSPQQPRPLRRELASGARRWQHAGRRESGRRAGPCGGKANNNEKRLPTLHLPKCPRAPSPPLQSPSPRLCTAAVPLYALKRSHVTEVGVPRARLRGGGVERDGPAGRLARGPAAACGEWPAWGRPAPRLCARQGRCCSCTQSGPAGPAPAPARTHARARSTGIFFATSSSASGVRPNRKSVV